MVPVNKDTGDLSKSPFSVIILVCSIVSILLPVASYVEGLNPVDDQEVKKSFCPAQATVDLTNALQNTSGFLDRENGRFFPLDIVRKRADRSYWACVCDLKPCLPICSTASNGAEDFVKYSAVPIVYNTNLTVEDEDGGTQSGPENRFHILTWEPCDKKNSHFLEPDVYEGDEFYLLKNGSLFLPRRAQTGARFLGLRRYCLILRAEDSQLYEPRVCSPQAQGQDQEQEQLARVKYVGALLAVPFLIATVVVYSVLPELRNIHGTCLRCYLCCLVVTYVALAADRIPPPDRSAGPLCLFLGFTIYFFFLACFFWLNVMCVDMWWRFGGFGSLRTSGAQRDRKKFIGYSIYAWGSAFLMTVICIGMEFGSGIPESLIRPEFRMNACWFNTKAAGALYFFGPIGITIACNVCFFIATSIKIVQHKRDTQRHLNSGDSRRHDDNKQWFSLYLKLSVIMGITWSTEVISWLWEGPKYLWLATDMLNALQGFLIFFIFVWKKKIWRSLKKLWNEVRFTRRGCVLTSRNSDSTPTTAVSDTVCCNVSVLVLEDMKNPEKPNTNQKDHQDPQVSR